MELQTPILNSVNEIRDKFERELSNSSEFRSIPCDNQISNLALCGSLIVSAFSEDCVIEAIEWRDLIIRSSLILVQ